MTELDPEVLDQLSKVMAHATKEHQAEQKADRTSSRSHVQRVAASVETLRSKSIFYTTPKSRMDMAFGAFKVHKSAHF